MTLPPEVQQCTGVLVEHRDGTVECTECPTCSRDAGQHEPVLPCGDVLAGCDCREAG